MLKIWKMLIEASIKLNKSKNNQNNSSLGKIKFNKIWKIVKLLKLTAIQITFSIDYLVKNLAWKNIIIIFFINLTTIKIKIIIIKF